MLHVAYDQYVVNNNVDSGTDMFGSENPFEISANLLRNSHSGVSGVRQNGSSKASTESSSANSFQRNSRSTRNKSADESNGAPISLGYSSDAGTDSSRHFGTDHNQAAANYMSACNNIYQKYKLSQLDVPSAAASALGIVSTPALPRKRPAAAMSGVSASLYVNSSIPPFYHNHIQVKLDEPSCRADMLAIVTDLRREASAAVSSPGSRASDRELLCPVRLLRNSVLQVRQECYSVGEGVDILYVSSDEWCRDALITAITAYEVVVRLPSSVRVSVFVKNIIHGRVILCKRVKEL